MAAPGQTLQDVLTAARSGDPSVRGPAENALKQLEQMDIASFMVNLMVELGTEDRAEDTRQLAGLVLKNLVAAPTDATYEMYKERWLNAVPEEVKAQLREGLVQILHSPVEVARHTAAQVVAEYGAVEVPNNQWLELIGVLTQNVVSAEDPVKVASLEALGFLCDKITVPLAYELTSAILTAVVEGIDAARPDPVRLAATVALRNSLEFATDNFEREVERNKLMEVMCNATQASDMRIRMIAFESLAFVPEAYYDKLQPYIETIFNLTVNAIQNDDPQVGLQGLEFWTTLAEEEAQTLELIEEQGPSDSEPYFEIAKQACGPLVPVVLGTLTQQDEDADETDWNIAMAGAVCLENLARVVRDDLVDHVIPFVESNIVHQNWRYREAAVMAFGEILVGPSPERLRMLVQGALNMLIQLLADPVPLVKDTSAWTLGRLCEYHAEAVPPEALQPLVTALLTILSDESPKVAAQGCYALHNLASACEDTSDEPSNPLSNFFTEMITQLVNAASREDADENNLGISAYEAVNIIIQNSAQDVRGLIFNLMTEMLNRLEVANQLETTSREQEEMRNQLQSSLCSCIHVCMRKLQPSELNTEVVDRTMFLLLQVMQDPDRSAAEEALMAIGQVANTLDREFLRFLPHILPTVVNALQDHGHYQLCGVAVGVVGDLSRALEKELIPNSEQLISLMLALLHSETLHRSVKPPVIGAIGDLALGIGADFATYTNTTMRMLMQACEMACGQMNTPELEDYINEFIEALIIAFSGIMQGLREGGHLDELVPFVEPMVQFFSSVYNFRRSDAVTKNLIGAIGDLGIAFQARVGVLLTQPFVMQLLQEGGHHSDESIREVATFAHQVITKITQTKS